MPEEALIPGALIAVLVLAGGVALLALRAPLTTRLLSANHHRQLMDPTIVISLVMLAGLALAFLGGASAGYFVLRLLGLFTPLTS